jgi:dolichyl-phosphate-mannose--protein O-mannosyl transferase
VKEQIGFVRWLFSGLELWQWVLILSLVFNAGSLFTLGTEVSSKLNLIGMCLLLIVFFKWFVLDTARASWARYKEHRNNLLTTIKDSHK